MTAKQSKRSPIGETDAAEAEGGLLAAARAAMPGAAAVDAAHKAVEDALRETGARMRDASNPADLVAEFVASVVAGGDSAALAGLGAATLAAEQAQVALAAQRTAVERVRERLRHERKLVHRKGADAGLAVLRRELDGILGQARAVFATLDGVEDADAALDRGKGEQWSTARHLAARYAELRHAQAVLHSNATVNLDSDARLSDVPLRTSVELVATYGAVRDYDVRYPLPRSTGKRVTTKTVGRMQVREEAYPSTDAAAPAAPPPPNLLPWTKGDAVANLRWMARPDARPWVPTMGELAEAVAAAEARRAADVPKRKGSLRVSEARGNQLSRRHGGG